MKAKPKTVPRAKKTVVLKKRGKKRPAMTAEQIFEYNQMMHRLEEQRAYEASKESPTSRPVTGEKTSVTKTADQWLIFLQVLGETAVVTKACIAANITRANAYDRRLKDPDFAAMWDVAYERGWMRMEEIVQKRAFEGVKTPQYRNGVLVDWSHQCSDALAMFVLKGRMRKIYGDKQEITVNNANRPYAKMTDKEIEDLLAARTGGDE